jgi:hypothetical protein
MLIITGLIMGLFFSCSSHKDTVKKVIPKIDYANPATIIYKTKGDYSKYIPVILSDDKSQIISYPSPKDIFYNGELAYPAKLSDGYLLDNRGVNLNSVFIKITYDEYSKLDAVPSLDYLYNLIIDKDPFTEMYNLGNRYQYKDEVNDINKIISNKDLNFYKKIK